MTLENKTPPENWYDSTLDSIRDFVNEQKAALKKQVDETLKKAKEFFDNDEAIEKDSFTFKVMKFESNSRKDQYEALNGFILKEKNLPKITYGPNGIDKVEGIKTAAELTRVQSPLFKKFIRAISAGESGHKYGILSYEVNTSPIHLNTKAMDRYQITPVKWIEWSKAHLGKVVQPTPQAVEYITAKQMDKYYSEQYDSDKDEYTLYTGLANTWNAGHQLQDKKTEFFDLNKETNYSERVCKHMGLEKGLTLQAKQVGATLEKALREIFR